MRGYAPLFQTGVCVWGGGMKGTLAHLSGSLKRQQYFCRELAVVQIKPPDSAMSYAPVSS